jgi:hypothetical protein
MEAVGELAAAMSDAATESLLIAAVSLAALL